MTDLSNATTDMERLLIAMEGYAAGDFSEIDTSLFDNANVANVFNYMVRENVGRNNRYLARINDAQFRIGDTSCLKSMFEQITAQQDAIRILQESRSGVNDNEVPVGEMNEEFLALGAQIGMAINPCLEEIGDTLSLLESLGIPEKDPWGEGQEDEMWETLRVVKENVRRSKDRMESIRRRVNDMSEDARTLSEEIDRRSVTGEVFLSSVDALTKSYNKLSAECLDTGRHLYRISRDIDNARNDMFRNNSKPTLHDMLRVFEVDHVTLAWRLYNNIVEFESLKLKQVNNTNACKLGLWIGGMQDERLLEAESFNRLVRAHENFHIAAVECFEAKQNYDTILAMDRFANVMDTLGEFRAAMEDLHVFLRSIGIIEETDVWKFRG